MEQMKQDKELTIYQISDYNDLCRELVIRERFQKYADNAEEVQTKLAAEIKKGKQVNNHPENLENLASGVQELLVHIKQQNKRYADEIKNFARKSELSILERQWKMFQPFKRKK